MTIHSIPNHLRVEMIARAKLLPNLNNARTHSDKQLRQIAASIAKFGFVVPIIIDDENRIVARHGRWAAADLVGLDALPCIRARFVTEADRRAFALADNRIAEQAGWDQNLLAAELNYLLDHDYALDVTGFTLSDLDLSIGDTSAAAEAEEIELHDQSATAVTQPGDLWSVGPHRLLCGSSLEPSNYEMLLGGRRAAMVVSDPPYNVPIDGHVSGLGKVTHREFAQASGEMTPAEFTMFLRTVFRHCTTFSTRGSIHYHCMDWRHIREIIDAADGVYSDFKQLLVWTKTNAGMGAFYRSQHELIFVFKNGNAQHINNFGLGETGRYRTNVLTYAGANTFRKGRADDLEAHPTVKPTALVADLILDCSNKGDLILDPFSGSATTLIAAHKTGRIGAAIEIDPLYVDAGLKRLQAASGLTAVHADGRCFAEIAEARSADL